MITLFIGQRKTVKVIKKVCVNLLCDRPFLWQFNEPHVSEAEVNQILQQLLSEMILDRLQEQNAQKSDCRDEEYYKG